MQSSQKPETIMDKDIVGKVEEFISSFEEVVVFFPSGNYNQLTELGRYKDISVAMQILSSINHPDSAYSIPEYRIFSLNSGKEIFVH